MPSNLKIPRLATAVLVLGGACGDDDKPARDADSVDAGTPNDASDTSNTRIDAVADALCKRFIECDGAGELAKCKATFQSYFENDLKDVNDDCVDALLDYYSCYAALSCAEIDEEDSEATADCALKTDLDKRCEGQLPEGDEQPAGTTP